MTAPTPTVLNFKRLSVRYDAGEDRLRIDAVDDTGAACGFWLTRRLASAWLKAMADWLQKTSPAAAAVPEPVRQQAVAMENAVIVGRRARDVAPMVPPQPLAGLIASIDLNRRGAQWSMVFKTAASAAQPSPAQGQLSCDAGTVHQVAQALVHQMQTAQWAEPIDLGWLAPAVASQAAVPGTLLN